MSDESIPADEQAAAEANPPEAEAAAAEGDDTISQGDIEALLDKTEEAVASIDKPDGELPQGVRTFEFKDLAAGPNSTEASTLELMRDVELDLKIELGRTHMHLEDVLQLRKGAVVTLDKLAGDPVDIYVNGRLIAHGEVLVLNDNFCVRVVELIIGESACA